MNPIPDIAEVIGEIDVTTPPGAMAGAALAVSKYMIEHHRPEGLLPILGLSADRNVAGVAMAKPKVAVAPHSTPLGRLAMMFMQPWLFSEKEVPNWLAMLTPIILRLDRPRVGGCRCAIFASTIAATPDIVQMKEAVTLHFGDGAGKSHIQLVKAALVSLGGDA